MDNQIEEAIEEAYYHMIPRDRWKTYIQIAIRALAEPFGSTRVQIRNWIWAETPSRDTRTNRREFYNAERRLRRRRRIFLYGKLACDSLEAAQERSGRLFIASNLL